MSTPKIRVLSDGEKRGTSFPLTEGAYSLGRSESCDICIPDSTISGHHCTLYKHEGHDGYYLRDEGSTNGTRVNSSPADPGVEIELHNGDIFQVGSIELLYDSGESYRMEGTRTATVVNLEDTGTTERTAGVMKNMGGKASARRRTIVRDNPSHKFVFIGIIGILGLCVAGALIYFVLNMFSTK